MMKNNLKNKNNNNITSEKNNKNKDNTTSKNSNEEKLLKELNEILPEELNMSEKNKKLYKELLEKQSAKNPVKTFFRILSYIRYNMKSYILGLFFLIVSSVLSIRTNINIKTTYRLFYKKRFYPLYNHNYNICYIDDPITFN